MIMKYEDDFEYKVGVYEYEVAEDDDKYKVGVDEYMVVDDAPLVWG